MCFFSAFFQKDGILPTEAILLAIPLEPLCSAGDNLLEHSCCTGNRLSELSYCTGNKLSEPSCPAGNNLSEHPYLTDKNPSEPSYLAGNKLSEPSRTTGNMFKQCKYRRRTFMFPQKNAPMYDNTQCTFFSERSLFSYGRFLY